MDSRNEVAIMQPYIFPYIGYFHLIEASGVFVFYDDVSFIKKGWINRNRILLNGKDHLFSVPVLNASQNRLINETHPSIDGKWKDTFHKQLTHSYRKAPYFAEVSGRVMSVFDFEYGNVADLAISSIACVYDYLGRDLNYRKSSVCSPETRGMGRADRLIEITRSLGSSRYVNAPGGADLYEKDYFASKGVELFFVKSGSVEYRQYGNEFVPWLSIVDVMMFNEAEAIRDFFGRYTLC